MQEIHYLLEDLLGFIFACHIIEFYSCLRLDVYFGIALAETHGVSAAHTFVHRTHKQLSHNDDQQNRQYPSYKKRHDR